MVLMQHITFVERQKLEFLVRCHLEIRDVARRLHRDHTVILRELKRNTGRGKPYTALKAQQYVEQRRQRKRLCKLDTNAQLYWDVRQHLDEGLSPEQIAGLLRVERGRSVISHETIYQYIYTGGGRLAGWYHYLRRSRRYRQPQQQRKRRKQQIPQRISIHERPLEIDQRLRYGDWETDSMVFSKQSDRLSVQYERKGQLVRMHKIPSGSAQATLDALRDSVESLPPKLWNSLTWDNGKEGTKHTAIRDDYGIDTYFCDPYASWQKGGVENMNGLIRQYLPRTTNLAEVSDADIQRIEDRLNNRPRKGLGYKTPNQVIQSYLQEAVHC